ncbi:MAG: AAA family ATPase [Candidatus Bathyarchaeia archaeon]
MDNQRIKSRKKLIVITGMPGSGKALSSKILKALGIPVLAFGDVVREEAKRRGLKPTFENIGMLMLKMREEGGSAIMAKRLIPKIDRINSSLMVLEGARSMDEVDELKRCYDVVVVAVHSSPETRYERLLARKRSDDPKSWEEFKERDERELKVGIGNLIALADKVVINEGSVEKLKVELERVFKEVMKNWMR